MQIFKHNLTKVTGLWPKYKAAVREYEAKRVGQGRVRHVPERVNTKDTVKRVIENAKHTGRAHTHPHIHTSHTHPHPHTQRDHI